MRRRRRLPWFQCILAGVVVGTGVGFWLSRPPGPFVPQLVRGTPPEYHFTRDEDHHILRIWELDENVDAATKELSEELRQDDGWQPALVRKLTPKTVQFARVHSPNGDFQFTRVTVVDLGNGKTSLTIDEEPKQAHAFKR